MLSTLSPSPDDYPPLTHLRQLRSISRHLQPRHAPLSSIFYRSSSSREGGLQAPVNLHSQRPASHRSAYLPGSCASSTVIRTPSFDSLRRCRHSTGQEQHPCGNCHEEHACGVWPKSSSVPKTRRWRSERASRRSLKRPPVKHLAEPRRSRRNIGWSESYSPSTPLALRGAISTSRLESLFLQA